MTRKNKDSTGRRTARRRGGKRRWRKTDRPRSAASDAAQSAHLKPASFSAATPHKLKSGGLGDRRSHHSQELERAPLKMLLPQLQLRSLLRATSLTAGRLPSPRRRRGGRRASIRVLLPQLQIWLAAVYSVRVRSSEIAPEPEKQTPLLSLAD